jgi:hypothetical protein
MCLVFRQHKAVDDVLWCNDDDDKDNYYFLLFFSNAAIRAKHGQRASHAHAVCATSVYSHDIWNIDLELVRS